MTPEEMDEFLKSRQLQPKKLPSLTQKELWKELSGFEEVEVRMLVSNCKKCYGRGYKDIIQETGKPILCSCVQKAWSRVLRRRLGLKP